MGILIIICVSIAAISLVAFISSGIILILKKGNTAAKIILFVSPIILIVSVIGGFVSNNQYQVQQREAKIRQAKKELKAAFKRANTYKTNIIADSYAAAEKTEDVGTVIYNKWQSYFNNDNTDYSSDGITKVVDGALSSQSKNLGKAEAKLTAAQTDLSHLKSIYEEYPNNAKISNDYSSSKKIINAVNKFYSNCSDPTGTYNGWTDKYNSLDNNLGDMFDSLYN
ncbi:hypothetical protein DSM07_01280 [Oenococcus sp. UCMA 16435]|nr:hypothetical protein DSM07_01280 [Oenococcus sp. UCMA 16435]MDI4584074.1 hypothetical protein [Oenococcus sp. UCMA 14587]